MAAEPIIEFDRVSFAFSEEAPLFEGVCLALLPGTFYLVTGPSGAGKSTLLRLINRLEEPTAGQVRFLGRPLADHEPPVLRRSILSVQQTPTALDASVRDNLLLPFSFAANRALERPDDDALRHKLGRVLLPDVQLDDHAQTLSVGQLQRLCFVRGLLLQPQVMLLDEPTSALDQESSAAVLELVRRIFAETGMTTVMVSHQNRTPPGIDPVVLEVRDRTVREAASAATPAAPS
ncbi:MAG: ABC transporter ATP-binding protein [bacterium]